MPIYTKTGDKGKTCVFVTILESNLSSSRRWAYLPQAWIYKFYLFSLN